MKKFRNFVIVVIIIEILIIILSNLFYINNQNKQQEKISREEINNQVVYRIEKDTSKEKSNLLIMNIALASMTAMSIAVYVYIGKKIVAPFSNIKEMPYEIAKGNLSIPIKEQKNKYFGRFTWGMDMLRENFEDSKKRELEYKKEKKTLILSLSHDIKTPLSAIKLYSKALKDNLYDTEAKKMESIDGIIKNTSEIEKYVGEIVKNSKDDFMEFEVENKGFYLDEAINSIQAYYKDKLEMLHTKFEIDKYNNCMINGDKDRTIEVLQNVMENAIKYGDGKEIKISFSEEEDYKLVTILNSGCTLKEEELPHIFDSFYRGSNTKKQDGSGLGLFICKKLMHKMNGDIYAEVTKNNEFAVTIVMKK